MYGLPRLCKALERSDFDSLRKCIRPLASGLRLQPGHDEISTPRSQIANRALARFRRRAYAAPINCLVIRTRTSQSAARAYGNAANRVRPRIASP